MDITPEIEGLIEVAKVARLATVDAECKPYLVPVVFVFDGNHFFIPIDKKRKTTRPEKLRRVKNIKENPNIALLIDRYSEDWTKLAFVMVQGKASIVDKLKEGSQLRDAYKRLMAKYPQYQKIGLGELCIMIKPEKLISWQNSRLK